MTPWNGASSPPTLYRLTANIQGENIQDSQSTTFGLRDFKAEGTQFNINGLTTFLRGKHDACVFPLTGHVPMDTAAWRRYFRIAKEYGINHCRFHSWCPPKACFEAADIEGFTSNRNYLSGERWKRAIPL